MHAKYLTITPETEKGSQGGGSLMALTKGSTTKGSIQRSLNVVLEKTLATIVREPFAKFDNGN
jgi:hypothetical protein